jgi:3-carboxy-cis,cis-muconate cycloisomerase
MADAIAFTLAAKIGRADAHKLIAQASQKAIADKRHFEEVLREDERIMAHLSAGDLGRLFEPMAYQGVAQTFIERLIASTKMRSHGRS